MPTVDEFLGPAPGPARQTIDQFLGEPPHRPSSAPTVSGAANAAKRQAPGLPIEAPIVNFLTYPIRAGLGDVAGAVYGATKPGEFGSRFYRARDAVMRPLTMPQSPFGDFVAGSLNTLAGAGSGAALGSMAGGLPGAVVGGILGTAAPELIPWGVKKTSQAILGPETTKSLAPLGTISGDVLPLVGARIGPMLRPARAGISASDAATAALQNQARKTISTTFRRGAADGGPSAIDAIEQINAARTEGQPFGLIDIQNPELRAAIGTIYRQGGEARAVIKDFLENRNVAQGQRVRGLVGKYISDGSMRDTATELLNARSARGRELFSVVEQGGSTAPLVDQLRRAADSAINPIERGDILARLVRAEADRTAKAPGAVWSPYLQRLLDLPEIQRGLRRGYVMERDKAAGGDRPFNPSEYAVVGETEEGEPIVGSVPNMKLLMTAKEGLDAAISENIDPITGRPTKKGQSLLVLRDGERQADGSIRGGFLPELDRLSPEYKKARDAWSGDTASFMALDKGKHLFDPKWFKTTEDVSEYFNGLGTNDREFVKMGVAADLKQKLESAVDARDRAKVVINNDRVRNRLRVILGNQAEPFIDAIERERVMRETPQKLYGGSQTAERVADDRSAALLAGGAATRAALALAHGHPLRAGGEAVRGIQNWRNRPNLPRNLAVARLLTDPSLALGTNNRTVLPRLDIPTVARPALDPTLSGFLTYGISPKSGQ